MVNIYLHPTNSKHPQMLSFHEFKEHFQKTCDEQKQSRRALAFAFVLYDLDNPEIASVISRNDYWNALNKISGHFLTIFSIHSNSPLGNGLLQRLDKPTKEILQPHFDEVSYSNLPSLLFFQVAVSQVVDSFYIKLKEERVEEAFLEIKKYIKAAVAALERIQPENHNNHSEIFQQLKLNVKSIESKRRFKEVINKSLSVHQFISIFFR